MEARPFIEQLRLFEDRYPGGVGERGSQEAMAGLFRRLGYRARVEGCVCHTNPAVLWYLHAALLLFAGGIGILHPPSGLILALLALASLHGESARRRRLVRWFLPKGISSNLIARMPDDGRPDGPRILFVAHGDVARRGLIHNHLLGWFTRGAAGRHKVHPLRAVIVVAWAQAIVLALRIPGIHLDRLDQLQLVPLAVFTVLLLLSLDWMRPRAAAGANDNSSGMAVIAAVAEHFAEHPARHGEVCFLITGSREAESGGMDAFLTTFGRTLPADETFVINVDDVGAGQLCFAVGERNPAPVAYQPLLPGLAAAVARKGPFRKVRPVTLIGVGDAGVATRHGYAAITLKALRRGRPATPIHTARDRMKLLETRSIALAYHFAVALAERVDEELGRPVRGGATGQDPERSREVGSP